MKSHRQQQIFGEIPGLNIPKTPKSTDIPSQVKAGDGYTFAAGTSDEFQKRFADFLSLAEEDLSKRLNKEALGDVAATPFASEREGSTLHVVWPNTLNSGDMLGELLSILCTITPGVIIHEGTSGWNEPEWSADASRKLSGVVAALQGPPDSFAASTSPVDLTRVAIWHEACSTALSKPGGVRDARGSVLPPAIAGGKTASKYMATVYAALRACISDEKTPKAVQTLERLIKAWCRSKEEEALDLIRRQKISWGTVLHKGAPTERKKIKGVEIINVLSPIKPSRSPWVTGAERTALTKLYEEKWSLPEKLRKEWIALGAREQHSSYLDYVAKVKAAYQVMSSISSHVHARLGHRKRWIFSAVRAAGVEPKSKKEKSNPFTWAQVFFKLDLTKLVEPVKQAFKPTRYLDDLDMNMGTVLLDTAEAVFSGDTTLDELANKYGSARVVLAREWLNRFQPSIREVKEVKLEEFKDDNPFVLLQDEEVSSSS